MSIVERRKASRVLTIDAPLDASTGGNPGILPRQPHYQNVAYAATVTLDPSLGSAVFIGSLTGNITLAAPVNAKTGDRLVVMLIQDATGGRTITWNAAFTGTPTSVTTTLGRTKGSFIYNGTVWIGG